MGESDRTHDKTVVLNLEVLISYITLTHTATYFLTRRKGFLNVTIGHRIKIVNK